MDIAAFLLIVSSVSFQDSTLLNNKAATPQQPQSVARVTVQGTSSRNQSTTTYTKAERAALTGRVKRGGWDYN